MKKQKKILFSIYRYQLVPLSTVIQSELFQRYSSYEDLIAKKNTFFDEIIKNENTKYTGRGYPVITKIEAAKKNSILLRMGVEKSKEVDNSNFVKEKIKDYPNIYIYINNEPEKQYILIQSNSDAFTETKAVANILATTLKRKLSVDNLAIYIEKKFDSKEFWETIKTYEGSIRELKFEFIKPNMSNISQSAVSSIRILKDKLNSHKTDLLLKAPARGVLENLNEDDQEINNLVDYQKEGGGPPPEIKITGLRHYIKTSESEITFILDSFTGSADDLIKILDKKIK